MRCPRNVDLSYGAAGWGASCYLDPHLPSGQGRRHHLQIEPVLLVDELHWRDDDTLIECVDQRLG